MTRMTRGTMVLALLLVALTMGLEFAHTLELSPQDYPPELYLRLNTSLYAWYGPPLGAAIWLGAMVTTGMLLFLLRQRSVRLFTGASLGLQLMAFANYFARVEPVNGRFRAVLPGQVPGDFTALRAQWEYGHAVGFGLFAVAWVALTTVHVMRRRRRYVGLLRSAGSGAPGRRRRVLTTTVLIGCASVVALSGFAQWAGFVATISWHAGSSTLPIGLAAMHVTSRLRRGRRRRPITGESPIAHSSSLTTVPATLRVMKGSVEYQCARHGTSNDGGSSRKGMRRK